MIQVRASSVTGSALQLPQNHRVEFLNQELSVSGAFTQPGPSQPCEFPVLTGRVIPDYQGLNRTHAGKETEAHTGEPGVWLRILACLSCLR